jgi:hypothetical protein
MQRFRLTKKTQDLVKKAFNHNISDEYCIEAAEKGLKWPLELGLVEEVDFDERIVEVEKFILALSVDRQVEIFSKTSLLDMKLALFKEDGGKSSWVLTERAREFLKRSPEACKCFLRDVWWVLERLETEMDKTTC